MLPASTTFEGRPWLLGSDLQRDRFAAGHNPCLTARSTIA